MKDIFRRVRGMNSGAVEAPTVSTPLPVHEAATSDYIGYLDKVGAGMVQGWACHVPEISRRLVVRLYLDDQFVAEGVADQQRDDVRDAGHGDGQYGFQLPVAKKALFCAEVLRLAVLDRK